MRLRDAAQEVRELGARGTLFRIQWELGIRGDVRKRFSGAASRISNATVPGEWAHRLQFEDATTIGRAMRDRIPQADLDQLRLCAEEAMQGRILCFGRWSADFGMPIDWHRSPVTGLSWAATAPALRALADRSPGDVKYCWEAGRFPHAYHLSRAAAFFPECADAYASALADQIEHFIAFNGPGVGVHWASGQEIALRMLAWLFALDVLLLPSARGPRLARQIAGLLVICAQHIEGDLDYARFAVYNNHLLSEAVALLAVGAMLPDVPEAARWRATGLRVLDEQAERQFYDDGGYICQSHNYHRVALQTYLWACQCARSIGNRPSAVWLHALDRSLEFLVAQQNPTDGRLPNYGSNDGAMPSILSTCDYSDMRPVLQAVSVLVRGERVYPPGPWDEATAWLFGVRALDAPLKAPIRRSVSFPTTGYHALRGSDPSSFATFRCGTLRDRFSQIDMLHVDVWWRGLNVLADPGSFQYNAAPVWHDHFMRTGSHNTLVVDGHDQMVHYRQFKVLYWTKAKLLAFHDADSWALCEGEHYGYRRLDGHCVHRRSVLFVKNDCWIVIDQVRGEGEHDVRLQWLGGDFSWAATASGMELATSAGPFTVSVYDSNGAIEGSTVLAGELEPPRGWLSRYYGQKVPAPSLVVERRAQMPFTAVSIMSGVPYDLSVANGRWTLEISQRRVSWSIADGRVEAVDAG